MHRLTVSCSLPLLTVCRVCHACWWQKAPGQKGFLVPAVDSNGKSKVILPEMLVGLMLEMVTGSERTPKGGLKDLLAAHEAPDGKVVTVREKTGEFGRGCYADEPWALVSYRKRVTSVRKFYHANPVKDEPNPGYTSMVRSTLISIGLLLGTAVKLVRAYLVSASMYM